MKINVYEKFSMLDTVKTIGSKATLEQYPITSQWLDRCIKDGPVLLAKKDGDPNAVAIAHKIEDGLIDVLKYGHKKLHVILHYPLFEGIDVWVGIPYLASKNFRPSIQLLDDGRLNLYVINYFIEELNGKYRLISFRKKVISGMTIYYIKYSDRNGNVKEYKGYNIKDIK